MRKGCLEHRSLARIPTRSCRTFRHALNLLARQHRFQSPAHMLGPLVLRLAQPTDAKNPKFAFARRQRASRHEIPGKGTPLRNELDVT